MDNSPVAHTNRWKSGSAARKQRVASALHRIAVPVATASVLHIVAWLLAALPECSFEETGLAATDVSCTGGSAGFVWTTTFLAIGFLGTPLLLALLLRHFHQAHAWVVAGLTEVALPLVAYSIPHVDALIREAVTQLVAVPIALVLLGTLFGRVPAPAPSNSPHSSELV